MNIIIYFIILLLIIYIINIFNNNLKNIENFDNLENLENLEITELLEISNRKFPFRYFKDENNNTLPIVSLCAFFRNDNDKKLYNIYINKNIKVIGTTAYKTFPNKITDDSEDKYHLTDDFDYIKNINNWLACMNNIELYNLNNNNIINISESDFYDADYNNISEKKYDFIYICNKDDDTCPLNGWNAINRNFNLALKCFPIMFNEFNLKGLIVGRVGCNLEELYKNNIEVTDWLEYHVLQEKMRQSKFLFVPNIYDASPRVITECICKDMPILMNQSIICGTKYITYQTGELFIDEHDIRRVLTKLIGKLDKISPRNWWLNNYGSEKSSLKLRNFLYKQYPEILENIKKVSYII